LFVFGAAIPEFERPAVAGAAKIRHNLLRQIELSEVGYGIQVASQKRITSSHHDRRRSMRQYRNSLAVLALLAAPTIVAAQENVDGARPVSLGEAVRLAQLNSPVTVSARNALRTGKLTELNALGQYLPSIRVSAGSNNTSGSSFFQGQFVPYTGPAWSYGKGYGASLLLFDGGQRFFAYKQTQALQTANAENETLQRYSVALSVKQAYYQVLQARELQAAGASALEAAQVSLNAAATKVRIGQATRTDSLKAAIQVGNAQLTLLQAGAQLRDANAALTRLVASNVAVTAIAADTADIPRLDVDDASLSRMANDGPNVRTASATYDATKQARRSTITNQFVPQVFANYTYNAGTSSNEFNWGGGPALSKNTNYGFSVGYTIFNNFSRELATMQATVNEENAEAALRDARYNAKAQLAQLVDQLRTALQTIDLQQLQIAAASEDLSATQSRYALGAASYLDLLTSQTALDAQRIVLIGARFQARTAKAAIEAFIGRDLK
jgi:outer membrane protein TolC